MIKNILITGSTDGIGKLAAIQFALDGHRVYIHGRNPEKLAKCITEIKEISGNENIKGFIADFSNLEDVKNMTVQVKEVVPVLDVLINNAGIFKSPIDTTDSGIDIRFTVNYLAPFILTNDLLPLLKKASKPRIINLSSAAQSPVSLAALSAKESLSVNDAYAQSKLALTMWSFDMAKRNKDLSVIAVNPGSLLNTRMAIEAYGQHWAPADKGANILHALALYDEYNDDSGKYFDNDKGEEKGYFAEAHSDAYDESKVDALLRQTEKLVL